MGGRAWLQSWLCHFSAMRLCDFGACFLTCQKGEAAPSSQAVSECGAWRGVSPYCTCASWALGQAQGPWQAVWPWRDVGQHGWYLLVLAGPVHPLEGALLRCPGRAARAAGPRQRQALRAGKNVAGGPPAPGPAARPSRDQPFPGVKVPQSLPSVSLPPQRCPRSSKN